MKVNSISYPSQQQSFGVRNVVLDPSLMSFSEKVLKNITGSISDIYKLGDEITDVYVKAVRKPAEELGENVDNNNNLLFIAAKNVFTAPVMITNPGEVESEKQMLGVVQSAIEALKKSSDNPDTKMFQKAVELTEKNNTASRSYSSTNIGFLADLKPNKGSAYSGGRNIGFIGCA